MKEVTWKGEDDYAFIVVGGETYYRDQPKTVANDKADAIKDTKNFTIRDTRSRGNSGQESSTQEDSGGPGGTGDPGPDATGTGTGAASKGRTP